ncbi:hypothetical protein [Cupriavidus sp. D39]|nr:hypothetical protein [Cupriavidus sp. D39]MCY0854633.1 hypothetical protein [Cupriavidus sp. D39]
MKLIIRRFMIASAKAAALTDGAHMAGLDRTGKLDTFAEGANA